MPLSELVATMISDRRQGNLSSAIRLFVLDHYRGHRWGGQTETRELGIGLGIGSALQADNVSSEERG